MRDGGKIKVALCQTNIKWENKKANIDEALRQIATCKRNGADMVFFPEMSFTGFSMNTAITRESDHNTFDIIRQTAIEKSIAIGFGWVEALADKSRNCYTVFADDGDEMVSYRKIHSFRFGGECDQFVSGGVAQSFEYMGMRFTPFICYDLRFPEIFRGRRDETDVYVIPANWPAKRGDHWRTLLRARAIENQAYVLGINCVGEIGDLDYSGDTMAVDPNGSVMDVLSDSAGIVFAELEKNSLGIRNTFPVRDDCKGGLYIDMLRNEYGVE